jgi:peptidoglycan-associated lipoprotein
MNLRFISRLALLGTLTGVLALSSTGCKKKKKLTDTETPDRPKVEDVRTDTPTDTSGRSGAAEDEARRQLLAQVVYFDYDRSDIRGDQRVRVKDNADILKTWKNWSVTVEGHCDERGTNEYNLALGERRATAAKNALVAEGIASGRLSTVSFGEERASDPGHTEAAWSRNRRAEFKVR